MITNEESAKMKRLTEVMKGTFDICHKLRTKNGVIGVEFDRGLYKGKFMPLYTQYDIEHLKIFIDQTRDEMNKKYNDNDNMIKLDDEYFITLEPDDIEEDVCEEYDAGELGSLDGRAKV
jgi:phosphopantetheine adenylyltransferase